MKVLMVLTSHDQLGNTGRKTGFWLEEMAAPYYVFKDAGAQITLASPKGGRPPLDPKSNEPDFRTDITRRFEKDADAEAQLGRTVRLDGVTQDAFDTVFYPGGHGPMWDLAEDQNSIKLIESFLAAGNHKLPAITQGLLNTSAFINAYLVPIMICLGSFVAAVIIGYRYKPAAKVMDHILLKIPVVGTLLRLGATTSFARGMGMLLEAGVPMITALDTSGNMIKNRAISGRVQKAKMSVIGGNSLHRPLAAGGEFLPMLPRMVAVGEETGTLSSVLEKVADFHDQQLQSYVKRMTLLIEPVMTVVVGFMVGFVYLAFFMAIYSITSA